VRIYNSLSRQVEEIEPLKKGKVGMYTCGMTVYDYAHIGHGRKYVYDDLLRRTLAYNGLDVIHVQNVTDVGHLVSDADEGEDKLEKGARKLKKTVWEVAKYFERDFFENMDLLGVLRPTIVARATEHIEDQIKLIDRLVDRGFAYDTPEAVYFDVGRFPRYEGLFGRGGLSEKQTAVRPEVERGEHKKTPADFALWFKRVGRFADHQMHWDCPWGDGFPGWHIECSAMSMKYLGETFDIHTGGLEHQMVHHPNEIAQSEAASGHPFVKYWVHYSHLTLDGVKMAKSVGNVLRVQDIIEKGFSPLALRYLYLTAHYRTPLNFTWSSMAAAQTAYDKLLDFVRKSQAPSLKSQRTELSKEKLRKLESYRSRFEGAINTDLGFPGALSVVWEMVKSNIPDYDKADALLDWDAVLGLNLAGPLISEEAPGEVKDMLQRREQLRREGSYVEADNTRVEMEKMGWKIEDTKMGSRLKKIPNY